MGLLLLMLLLRIHPHYLIVSIQYFFKPGKLTQSKMIWVLDRTFLKKLSICHGIISQVGNYTIKEHGKIKIHMDMAKFNSIITPISKDVLMMEKLIAMMASLCYRMVPFIRAASRIRK